MKVSQSSPRDSIINYAPKSRDHDSIHFKLLIECLDIFIIISLSIQHLSCIWNLPTKLQISSCLTNNNKICHGHSDLKNYRPASNLFFIAEVREKHVLSKVFSYLNSQNLYKTFHSTYRYGHNTESALLKVATELSLSLNKGNTSVLALFTFLQYLTLLITLSLYTVSFFTLDLLMKSSDTFILSDWSHTLRLFIQ